MEKPQQPEKSAELRENLEKFKEELEGGIEFIQSLDFLVEAGELSEEEAKQAQIIFEDFESIEGLREETEELSKVIKERLGNKLQQIDQYKIQGAEDIGGIEVTVFKTDEEGVNLTKFKYANGDVVVALRPDNFEEEKI